MIMVMTGASRLKQLFPEEQTALPPAGERRLGWWRADASFSDDPAASALEPLRLLRHPLYLVSRNGGIVPVAGGSALLGSANAEADQIPLVGYAPPCLPEGLGDPAFCADLGIRYPYLGGSMAKGISSVAMAEELGRGGMLGFYGAAGLPLATVEAALDRLAASRLPYGINLIHSPQEPDLEKALAELYIRRGVRLVEASAFLAL